MSVTYAFVVPRPTIMVVSSSKAPSSCSPISMTLSDGEPRTVRTLPVQLTFFASNSPKLELQPCWLPIKVPPVHPTRASAAQPTTNPHNANWANVGCVVILPTAPLSPIREEAGRDGVVGVVDTAPADRLGRGILSVLAPAPERARRMDGLRFPRTLRPRSATSHRRGPPPALSRGRRGPGGHHSREGGPGGSRSEEHTSE